MYKQLPQLANETDAVIAARDEVDVCNLAVRRAELHLAAAITEARLAGRRVDEG